MCKSFDEGTSKIGVAGSTVGLLVSSVNENDFQIRQRGKRQFKK